MKTIIKALVLIIVLGIISLPFMFLDNKPLVEKPNKLKPESLKETSALIKSIHKQLLQSPQNHQFSVSLPQLKSLLALASQTLKPVSARANHLDNHLFLYVSVELPLPFSWRFLNLQVTTSGDFITSPDSFSKVGALKLSNKTVITLAQLPLYMLFSDRQREAIQNSIVSIAYQNNRVNVQADPLIDLEYLSYIAKSKAKQALRVASSKNDKRLNDNIEYYYGFLNQLASYIAVLNSPKLSLQSISAPLFQEVQKRTINKASAKAENKAALFALALFVGDYNLQTVIQNSLGMTALEKSPHKIKITLRQRRDLALHFIYSAMIKVLANSNISHSIGEIKEVSDSVKGGSGFSFPDLLADRAGTQFAISALDSSISAKKLQRTISATTTENDFFPSIIGLPEGLSAQQFRADFGKKGSARYQQVIKEIDGRINALAIYQ